MRHKQPSFPPKKFADRKKKPITPQIQEKLKLEAQRHLEKLERQTPKPTNPEYKGLMAALIVGADPEFIGLVAGLCNIDIEDPAESESNDKPIDK